MSGTQKPKLTDKQTEALALAADHHTSKEIARLLDISPRTVEQRLDAAKRKLGASSRAEAARMFSAMQNIPYNLPCKPDPIAVPTMPAPQSSVQQDAMTFRDAYAFQANAPWETATLLSRKRTGIEDLGPAMRIAIVVGIAIGLGIAVLTVLGIAEGLEQLF